MKLNKKNKLTQNQAGWISVSSLVLVTLSIMTEGFWYNNWIVGDNSLLVLLAKLAWSSLLPIISIIAFIACTMWTENPTKSETQETKVN